MKPPPLTRRRKWEIARWWIRSGITLVWTLGSVIFALMVLNLIPYANGHLIGGDLKPIAGKLVVAWDSHGEWQGVNLTGRKGEFWTKPNDFRLSGYAKVATNHHTGGNPFTTCVFSPYGEVKVAVVDEEGRPWEAPLRIAIPGGQTQVVTGGFATYEHVGVGVRDRQLHPTNDHGFLPVKRYERSWDGKTVHYRITLWDKGIDGGYTVYSNGRTYRRAVKAPAAPTS